ncbi:A/G-specific adenine glycosylase [Sulfurimonas sp.]
MSKFSQEHIALLSWYANVGRHDLPWRNTQDIYHIYLSEIMLQQTQVNRVRDEYYPKFLKRFPTMFSLANAQLDEVFSLWSGLGYYSRARNLHKTATIVKDALPLTQKELMKLPGIGKYTASAICSFGYKQNISVVDTNIARVLKRYFALINPKDKEVWEYATAFINAVDTRAHNFALMDLGSLVCLPKNPKCSECPLSKRCQAKDEPELYTQTKKKLYESLELFYAIMIKENKVALKISQDKLYKGMLVLPSVDPLEENFYREFRHSYTKYRLSVKLYKVDDLQEKQEELIWLDLDKLEDAPISSLTKKALL